MESLRQRFYNVVCQEKITFEEPVESSVCCVVCNPWFLRIAFPLLVFHPGKLAEKKSHDRRLVQTETQEAKTKVNRSPSSWTGQTAWLVSTVCPSWPSHSTTSTLLLDSGFSPHLPGFRYQFLSKALGATMWFFIFYRARCVTIYHVCLSYLIHIPRQRGRPEIPGKIVTPGWLIQEFDGCTGLETPLGESRSCPCP